MTARPRPSCPPPELVQAAHEGVLSGALEARVSEHVRQCSICRALVVALDDPATTDLTAAEQDRILARVRAGAPTEARRPARTWRWAAAAVIVLTAAGSALIWQSNREPASPVAQPVLMLDKPGMPPADQRVDPINAPSAPERAELLLTLAPYRGNDYVQAARSLEQFVARHPQNAAGHFFLGVSNLILDRAASAVPALEVAEKLAASSDPWIAQRASWYLALAYRRTGQSDLARTRLLAVCNEGGEFAKRACESQQAVEYRVSGAVIDAATGGALGGALVGEFLARNDGVMARSSFSASTDASGRYTVSGQPQSGRPPRWLRASKWGYFSANQVVSPGPDMRADFRLTQWTLTALGDVTGTLTPGVGACAAAPQPCRQFAVRIPRSGVFEVVVPTPSSMALDLWVETPQGDLHSPAPDAPGRVAISAFAGAVYQITIVNNSGAPRSFELTMRLR